jgi:hypothetical protein
MNQDKSFTTRCSDVDKRLCRSHKLCREATVNNEHRDSELAEQ